ncbi:TPA: hypothetical protein DCL28_00610 [Candidatus Komeilibacteria bacterium]|nr:MAG: hypothetical protein A3J95_00115 [Candidatus Komeilibacteria bacterium RIFOXYC2_FULL_45_12]OGY93935.1 MAG: hypothetical protein A2260_01310 [Candidatus Komeilibacteria bacterium RIFOXYA2_FULL_45_9]HAH04046.1 hypothetical protein [Candidatus Komeilibacteria bacterium]HBV01798.1 hypothetical protein [Candidatus Komeilibacteria bacterium]
MGSKLHFNERSKNLIARIRHRYYLHKMLRELDPSLSSQGPKNPSDNRLGGKILNLLSGKPKAPKKGAVGEKRF